MRIHILQHVPFEGPGSIERWAQRHGAPLTYSRMFAGDPLPATTHFDMLVVMGGPMNIYEEDAYPWLSGEKMFIKKSIAEGKIVLGVCLGAQLIADVLGAAVTRNRHREIGWFPLSGIHPALAGIIPDGALVIHWHGDTFAIPSEAEPLAQSEACQNQGFIYDRRVIGLQFHLETTMASLSALIDHCRDELAPSPYVQTAEAMLAHPQRFDDINRMMSSLLDYLNALGPRG